jgi:hypothetical protein
MLGTKSRWPGASSSVTLRLGVSNLQDRHGKGWAGVGDGSGMEWGRGGTRCSDEGVGWVTMGGEWAGVGRHGTGWGGHLARAAAAAALLQAAGSSMPGALPRQQPRRPPSPPNSSLTARWRRLW